MHSLGRLLLAACATALAGTTAAAQTFSPDELGVVKVQRARMDAAARRDLTAWSRYVADDCIFSGDDGSIATKAKMLAYYTKVPADYDRALDPREYVVHLYGDTAVVNLRATDHELFGGTDLTGEQRRTETFIRRDGSWLAVAIQWSVIPVNHREPVVVEGRSYQDYVGQFQTRPKDDLETLSIRDGKLWSQTGDDGDWCQPAGGDTFFYKLDLGSFTFSRDVGGHVTGYVNQRPDGQTIVATKIK